MRKYILLFILIFMLTGCGSAESSLDFMGIDSSKVNLKDNTENIDEYIHGDNKYEKGSVVNIYVFAKKGCPHCEKAHEYFKNLSYDSKYGEKINYNYFEVFDTDWSVKNSKLESRLYGAAENIGDTFSGTPYIIVGEKSFDGWNESDMADDIKLEIDRCYSNGYTDPVPQK